MEAFEELVTGDQCAFRCQAVTARRPVPGMWFGWYRFGIVRRGVVIRSRVDMQGRTTAIDAAGPGCLFLLADAQPRDTSSVAAGYAATDALVCLCDFETVDQALRDPSMGRDLIRLQETAIERMERLAEARGRPTALSRVAALLCALADTLSPPRQRQRIPPDLQQRDLAALLGLRHETVCRVLAQLVEEGSIARDGDGLHIVDREALQAL